MKIEKHIETTYTCYYRKYSKKVSAVTDEEINAFLLEEHFRKIITPLIFEFESRMKKQLLLFLGSKGYTDIFWFNESKFDASYTKIPTSGISGYEEFINKALIKLRSAKCVIFRKKIDEYTLFEKKIILRDFRFDHILFYISFGTFLKFLRGIHKSHLEEFCDSFVTSDSIYYKDHSYFKLMNIVRYTRNRCAHSNQILSTHMHREIAGNLNINIDHSKYNIFESNLLTTLVFVLSNVSNKSYSLYNRKLIKFFNKNSKFINLKYDKLNLDFHTSYKWNKTLKVLNK